jgi:hypothetical protein
MGMNTTPDPNKLVPKVEGARAKPADPRVKARQDRLKAALKANMARRKAQAKARDSADNKE